MTRVLYNAPLSSFWTETAKVLSNEHGFEPVFWMGVSSDGVLPKGCIYYDAWNAFRLQSPPDLGEGVDTENAFAAIRDWEEYPIHFRTYLRILNRVEVDGSFPLLEREPFFARQLRWWINVVKRLKPDLYLAENVPHCPNDYPLYMCLKFFGVKTLSVRSTPLRGWYYLCENITDADPLMIAPRSEVSTEDLNALEEEAVKRVLERFKTGNPPFYLRKHYKTQGNWRLWLRKQPRLGPLLDLLSLVKAAWQSARGRPAPAGRWSLMKRPGSDYSKQSLNYFQVVSLTLKARNIKIALKRELDAVSSPYQDDHPYYFYPLHYQPEQTTVPLGYDFCDQLSLVHCLAENLPEGRVLVVKEHPCQFMESLYGHQGRCAGFYRELAGVKGVHLANLESDTHELIAGSKGVISLTGTAAWEGLVLGKPAMIFGQAWYSSCPGVIRVRQWSEIESAMAKMESSHCEESLMPFLKEFSRRAFRNNIFGRPDVDSDGVVPRSYQDFASQLFHQSGYAGSP